MLATRPETPTKPLTDWRRSVARTFDVLNRPVRHDYLTDGTNEVLTYDKFGNIHTVTNATVSYTFTYDQKNRLTQKLDSRAGKSLLFTYDNADNILTKTDYQGDVTHFEYDSSDRLVAETNAAYLNASYQYDPAGRLLNRILSDGAKNAYTWDSNGRLNSLIETSANGTQVFNIAYQRDRIGNVTYECCLFTPSQLTSVKTFSYDALYRLDRMKRMARPLRKRGPMMPWETAWSTRRGGTALGL